MIKKIVLFFITVTVYLSCDEALLKDTASIQLNPLPEGTERIHLAIFDGSWDDSNLIKVLQITSSSTNIEVPAGNNMTFLFVAENNNGKGEYFAVRNNIYVNSDGTSNLGTVDLNKFDNTSLDPGDGSPIIVNQLNYNDITDTLSWTDVGATGYDIYYNGEYIDTTTNDSLYQFGAGHDTWGEYYIVCYYSFFGIKTIISEQINIG